MALRYSRPTNIAAVLGTIVFLGIVLGGYYYLRTTTNRNLIDARNLRELARVGRAIEARVANLETILENLATRTDDSLDMLSLGELSEIRVSLHERPTCSVAGGEVRPPVEGRAIITEPQDERAPHADKAGLQREGLTPAARSRIADGKVPYQSASV